MFVCNMVLAWCKGKSPSTKWSWELCNWSGRGKCLSLIGTVLKDKHAESASTQPSYGRQHVWQRAGSVDAQRNSRHPLRVTPERFTPQSSCNISAIHSPLFLQHLNDPFHTLVIYTQWFTLHLSTAVEWSTPHSCYSWKIHSPLFLRNLSDSLPALPLIPPLNITVEVWERWNIQIPAYVLHVVEHPWLFLLLTHTIYITAFKVNLYMWTFLCT
jgi:hypothetical protein